MQGRGVAHSRRAGAAKLVSRELSAVEPVLDLAWELRPGEGPERLVLRGPHCGISDIEARTLCTVMNDTDKLLGQRRSTS